MVSFFFSFLKAVNQLMEIDSYWLSPGRSWVMKGEPGRWFYPASREYDKRPLPHFLFRCSTCGSLQACAASQSTSTMGTQYAIEHQDVLPCWRCSFTSKMLAHRTQNYFSHFIEKVKDGGGVQVRFGCGIGQQNSLKG